MKKLVFFAVLLLWAAAAAADDRDFLLTSDGTFFTAAVEDPATHPGVKTGSRSYIVVTERPEGGEAKRHVVPATLNGGYNTDPALAYDSESRTLFVFWRYAPYPLSSELRFTALDTEGSWSEPVSFEAAAYNIRKNLRVAVTTKAQKVGKDGIETLEQELNVHAFWWEESGSGESARYAMLTLEKGQVRLPIPVQDLSSFLTKEPTQFQVDSEFNDDILRHPSVFASPTRDSVDVIFGDVKTKALNRLRLTPVGDARVRIPVGRREREIAPPARFKAHAEGSIAAVAPSDDRIAFYFKSADDALSYIVWRDDKWSAIRSISLDETVNTDTAVEAIRRMVSSY